MTLDASGNLGIGTTSPQGTLEVKGPAYFTRGTKSFLINANYGTSDVLTQFQTASGMALAFATNGDNERARIDSSGNLLWAKTSEGQTTNGIQFATDGANISRLSIGGASSAGGTGISLYSTTAGAFRFFVSYAGQINATSTSITAISDQSLKENIRDLDTGLFEVMALRPRRFDWKEETQLPDRNVAGFIAQEVAQVMPDLVYDYQYSETESKKSLKMGDMLPTLVKAIQEQQAIISAQSAVLESLKARLDAANL
jgi:hypothetical protein